MLSKKEVQDSVVRAIGTLGSQLYHLRVAGRHRLKTVSQATGLSIDDIDRIENWSIDILNLEKVIHLAAFYDKRIVVDFIRLNDEKDC